MPAGERDDARKKIVEGILESSLYKQARCVYTYVSVKDEADTLSVIKESFLQGKRVAVPRVRGKRIMEFYFIRSLADLQPGFRGIPEPGPWCPKAPYPGEDTLMVMPGLAFDRSGARIGYGGGYYDVYLEKHRQCRRVAPAFSCQIVEEIPAGEQDVPVEFIFTEKELIVCGQDFRRTR